MTTVPWYTVGDGVGGRGGKNLILTMFENALSKQMFGYDYYP